ncbi:MAG: hypothetical protein OXK82_05630 [Deltaproteobacteria bacterium]|nr:hypothetical protein [Deltaproteobacteria bacterium]
MATTVKMSENHWQVHMAARDECKVTVELHLTPDQAEKIINMARRRLDESGLTQAPTPDLVTAMMMRLSTH